jgi:ABC-type nickel/cobalt efflux system permease component RcnA
VISAGPVAVYFENGIEPAGSIITGGFLDELSDVQLTKNVYIVELMILACFIWRLSCIPVICLKLVLFLIPLQSAQMYPAVLLMYFISAAVILLVSLALIVQVLRLNRLPRNRLPRVMKRYSPTGRRNHDRPFKRLLDT